MAGVVRIGVWLGPMSQLPTSSYRGSQYASGAYRPLLAIHGLTASMSRTGDCGDNAMAEGFFGLLKTELADGTDWVTRATAQRAVFEYLEVSYKRRRRLSALGYLSPAGYEARRAA